MSWLYLALLGAFAVATVNIFDSHLLSKRLPSLRALLLPAGIVLLVYNLVLFRLFPLPDGTSTRTVMVAVASGIIRAGAVTIMLNTLKSEEVSRVIPVVYTYPIFVAIMAMPLLGESLRHLQWVAIIIVVAGAVMISARESPAGATTWKVKPMLLLFCSSLLFALADITSKYALDYISPWNLLWIASFCVSALFLSISLRRQTIEELGGIKQRGKIFGVIASYETLAFVGMILTLSAIEKGPVSLVSTIIGSRPAFVVIIALILSRAAPHLLEWHPGRGMLPIRLIATAMIIGGIAIINLS